MVFVIRLHDPKLPGKPDLVLKKYRAAIFINGCFWHGHKGCKYFVIPKTRTSWWKAKIERTKEIDEKHQAELSQNGWKVITVWACELKGDVRDARLTKLAKEIIEPHEQE